MACQYKSFSIKISHYLLSLMILTVRPCIPNFKPNIRVGFQVGTSFSRFPKFNFNVIFCNFWKVWNRTNSEFSVNSENRVFWPKNRKLFPNYFREIFASSKRLDISKKFPNLKTELLQNSQKQKVQKIPYLTDNLLCWM